ncbi:hypothetical protein DFR70_11569 [Nocardia tenerifensis]|uniref:Uncharacterized protein n=1 Tax=Nocardia tenerifensis TaxID=228006 RepID=A0A318JWT6_9NOCA|nr:hypothetical protein [Nocardia tenerifensis]PXX58096.1 hypothetical protein DFR70_11569 [Nocardia tenerifensis]
MFKAIRTSLVIGATCASALLFPIAAQAAPAPATSAVVAQQLAPWIKYGVYSTQTECGQVGHSLVNRDKYADYKCSRELAGWGLWVHN